MHTARQIVTRVQTSVIKARSIAAENGTVEVAEEIQPRLMGTTDPLSLFAMTEAYLAGGREPSPMDVMNLLGLAGRIETFPETYFIINHEELPDAIETMIRLQQDVTA